MCLKAAAAARLRDVVERLAPGNVLIFYPVCLATVLAHIGDTDEALTMT
jgi:hypothetical protein